MGKLIYTMLVSLDGFVAGEDGSLDWHVITQEWHRFVNEQAASVDAMLFGRRMWTLMDEYWPYAEDDASAPDFAREYSRIWKSKPKYVCSTTLTEVGWGAQLLRSVDDVVALRERSAGVIGFGGPDLARSLAERDLIDEYTLYYQPVLLGAGKPLWARGSPPLALELLESRLFESGVIYAHYGPRAATEATAG